MSLSEAQKREIKQFLSATLEEKLDSYARETSSMPFLSRLIQDNEKVAAYSFIHSIATTLGMSIYEKISEIIARPNSQEARRKVEVQGGISPAQTAVIEKIINELRASKRVANKEKEIEEVLSVDTRGSIDNRKNKIADFFMRRDNIEHYFEIKTVKPNIDVFTESKRKLLEWIARRQKNSRTILAFPYNPYEPEPYVRFTEQGVLDRKAELMVGSEYWDFLGGKDTYKELLGLFDSVGREFKQRIQVKIEEVAKRA
jgi:hypothetical protein